MSATSQRLEHGLLQRTVKYEGEVVSTGALTSAIAGERQRQDQRVGEVQTLRGQDDTIRGELSSELVRMRELTDSIKREAAEAGQRRGFWRSLLGSKKAAPARSLEQLLRQQYEICTERVKAASELADRMTVVEKELFDEIDRLNRRIIESSTNATTAAEFIAEVQEYMERLDALRSAAVPESLEAHTAQANLDRARRLVAEHGTQLQLFQTAAERLGRLRESTRLLSGSIANLRSDITQYVMAASEKLDLVAGQIRAIGTAADAALTLADMRQSLDLLGESINQTTRFVSETQRYFRENLDQLVGGLEVYDQETRVALKVNLEMSRNADEQRIGQLVKQTLALKGKSLGNDKP